MGKISRNQLLSRLDALENKITGLTPLTPEEIKELEAALELLKTSGEFAPNEHGDFLKCFEEEYGFNESDDIEFQKTNNK